MKLANFLSLIRCNDLCTCVGSTSPCQEGRSEQPIDGRRITTYLQVERAYSLAEKKEITRRSGTCYQ